MSEPLENLYFNWLSAKVLHNYPTAPSTNFDTLFKTLHNLEFVWFLPGDDNRAEDGKELRREFLLMLDLPDQYEWRTQLPASVFEVLIAFARRAEKNSSDSAIDWFWEFLDNLSLANVTDDSGVMPGEIVECLELFMFRTYTPDGDGGLFPIARPERDQREIEIWQQFCDYLVDQNRLP